MFYILINRWIHFHLMYCKWIFDTSVLCTFLLNSINFRENNSFFTLFCRIRLSLWVHIYTWVMFAFLLFYVSFSFSNVYERYYYYCFYSIRCEETKKKVHLLFRYIFTITKSVLGKNWLSHGHVNLFCHFFFFLLPLMFSGGLILSSS